MFADRYIQNNVVYAPFIHSPVSPELSMIVVIPCLNEPEILRTLRSLWGCTPPDRPCEVIVCVNDSEAHSPEIKAFNQQTYCTLLGWKRENDRADMVLHPIYVPLVKAKFAGAGMARKIGLDEAIRRFNSIGKPDGILISLDSDCLVSPDYLQKIESVFLFGKSCFAATINFRHRADETPDSRQQSGIRLYEDYLRYYKHALEFTGFPNAIYTIGSAFAVRAGAYVKQGGMNRRQAGEDFYFLNKLTKLGKLTEIEDMLVFPSARVSDRVPFGTGAAMTKWMAGTENLALTYNFTAFLDLKQLFDRVDSLYRMDDKESEQLLNTLPSPVTDCLEQIDFLQKLAEINQNSSSPESFRKRFFQFFDAFLILRFLNLAHQKYYSRQQLSEAIRQLQNLS